MLATHRGSAHYRRCSRTSRPTGADRDRPDHRRASSARPIRHGVTCRCTTRCTAWSRRRRPPGRRSLTECRQDDTGGRSRNRGEARTRGARFARGGACRRGRRKHDSRRREEPIVIGWAYDSTARWRRSTRRRWRRPSLHLKTVNARGGARAAGGSPSRPATRRGTSRPCQGVRREAARTGRGRHLHDLRRRARSAGRAGGDQPRQARRRCCIGSDQMGPKRFGPRAGSRSATATSPRTRARRWPSTRGSAAGAMRRSPPTR